MACRGIPVDVVQHQSYPMSEECGNAVPVKLLGAIGEVFAPGWGHAMNGIGFGFLAESSLVCIRVDCAFKIFSIVCFLNDQR
jgi:hypothetical protein